VVASSCESCALAETNAPMNKKTKNNFFIYRILMPAKILANYKNFLFFGWKAILIIYIG
jgi:hypothetical protein